jgi:hypothetical protein
MTGGHPTYERRNYVKTLKRNQWHFKGRLHVYMMIIKDPIIDAWSSSRSIAPHCE